MEPGARLVEEIVRRGIARGDVRPEAANGFVFDTMPAMMMYRSKVCACEWYEPELEAMVDQLMLPLLRPSAA